MMKKLLSWVAGVMCVTCAWADAELTLADVQKRNKQIVLGICSVFVVAF